MIKHARFISLKTMIDFSRKLCILHFYINQFTIFCFYLNIQNHIFITYMIRIKFRV